MQETIYHVRTEMRQGLVLLCDYIDQHPVVQEPGYILKIGSQNNTTKEKDNNLSCHLMTKPTKRHVRPAKTQVSLDIRPV